MKNEVKDGSQNEMFLLCYTTDLPRVKEKRWWHSGILQECMLLQMYNYYTQWQENYLYQDQHMQKLPK